MVFFRIRVIIDKVYADRNPKCHRTLLWIIIRRTKWKNEKRRKSLHSIWICFECNVNCAGHEQSRIKIVSHFPNQIGLCFQFHQCYSIWLHVALTFAASVKWNSILFQFWIPRKSIIFPNWEICTLYIYILFIRTSFDKSTMSVRIIKGKKDGKMKINCISCDEKLLLVMKIKPQEKQISGPKPNENVKSFASEILRK